MPTPSSSDPREKLRPIVPKLIDLTEKVLFGDVWERPGLSKRDRSLITVVDAQHQGLVGRVEVKANYVANLFYRELSGS
jgi:alkylhydroperoxidase/carboxymuconolactone decarboxylase family protein YurZ